jgi:hypothetical protein
MALPAKLKKKYLDRFDQLIQDGESIARGIANIDERSFMSSPSPPRRVNTSEENQALNSLRVWEVNYISLLDQVIPKSSVHRNFIDKEENLSNHNFGLKIRLSRLKALRDDFEQGFLDDLGLQIEANITADYMGQAEQLLTEGQSGKSYHIPAAVLAGAVLEKGLRTICTKQSPPLPIEDASGKPLMMNRLIDDLKKATVFNELQAKQLRAWADVRNAAAHGKFDEFTRGNVEPMIGGITNFLADHLS